MDNAILIGLSRQMTLKRQMDVIANNLANLNTAGFKADSLRFEEFLGDTARDEGIQGASGGVSFVLERGAVPNMSAGAFERTGNDLDVAISAEAWLVVQTPEGERYTRNGQLKLNAAGQLVTGDGYKVLGGGGPITFSPRESGITIAADGSISTSEGDKDVLRLVRLPDPSAVTKEGATLFVLGPGPACTRCTGDAGHDRRLQRRRRGRDDPHDRDGPRLFIHVPDHRARRPAPARRHFPARPRGRMSMMPN